MKKTRKYPCFIKQLLPVLQIVIITAFVASVFSVTVSPAQITFSCGQTEEMSLGIQSVDEVKTAAKGIAISEPVFVKPGSKVLKREKIASEIADKGVCEVMITLNLDKADAKAKTLPGKIDDVQGRMVSQIAALHSDIKYVCENIPVITAKIDSATFEYLKKSDIVSCVEAVIEVQTHTAQGIPLIGGDVYRSVYDGSGAAVAIVDSGIDYTHPALGGGGFPNCKVIGGYDFGSSDADPKPAYVGHGTHCAGTAAGDIVNYADYIGGVAPGSRLYALKVMADGSGSATNAAITSAIDWCISHQLDDPNNPILVISMSLGSGGYAGTCDDASAALTNAVNAANAAGITVLASSGNSGLCNAIAFPACMSGIISVGAVFDYDIGIKGFCLAEGSCIGAESASCTPPYKYYSNTSEADKVTPYSNSSPLVDVLASSNNVYTTDIKGVTGSSVNDYYGLFGGTSAACAYAAGAAAAIQCAAFEMNGRFLNPSEVRNALKGWGEPIEDWKNSVITPRINIAASIENLDIFNAPQFTVENASGTPATISGITSPQWVSVFPLPPVELEGYGTMVFYAQGDCASCNYEDMTGQIVIEGTGFGGDFTEYVQVDMICPACTLSANLNEGCFVDLADVAMLSDCWLSSALNCQNADLNGSGDVGLADLALMIAQWLDGNVSSPEYD